jgi:acetolactate decarboxylase
MNMKAAIVLSLAAAVCAMASELGNSEGLVKFIGAQNQIFETGKADAVLSLLSLQGGEGIYAVGPVKGLDGEITILDSRPYITRVRGEGYTVDHSWDQEAIFLVWSNQQKWREVVIPESVRGYLELQKFVKAQAGAAGIDSSKPFPFLLAGAPSEIKWHVNVDKSEGKPITQELFAKSKASYVIKGEPVDMIGFYSEHHPGVFITKYTPAIQPASGASNALHIHFVSRKGDAAGHVDDLQLGAGMVLRLPVLP